VFVVGIIPPSPIIIIKYFVEFAGTVTLYKLKKLSPGEFVIVVEGETVAPEVPRANEVIGSEIILSVVIVQYDVVEYELFAGAK
jgi:hypothetical protein